MQIFLSYDTKSHQEFAAKLTKALADGGLSVWQDQHRRRNLLRLIQSWRDATGELGLDSWLSQGILQSDMVVALIPYNRRPDYFPDSWNLVPVEDAEKLLEIVAWEGEYLRKSYRGEASSRWSDPRHLDQAWYYLMRPVHSTRMAWYEKHGLPPLGKDPFEHWRRWEMRVAGAVQLPVVLIVLIEPREEPFAETVSAGTATDPRYVVLRHSWLADDLRDRLLPAIEHWMPNEEDAEDIRQRKRKLRHLRRRATITIWLWVGLATGIVALLIGGIVFVIITLLRG